MAIKKLCISLSLIFLSALCFSQTQSLRFTHISIEEGMSQSVVNSLVQDQLGFMWIGTDDGLNLYDGYEFTVFRSKPGDKSGLVNNKINALFADEKGNVWIGTSKGMDCYNIHTKQFERNAFVQKVIDSTYNAIITDICMGDDGTLWISTWGKGLIKANETLNEVFTLKEISSQAQIQAILYFDKSLLIAIDDEFKSLDFSTAQVNLYHYHQLNNVGINNLFVDSKGIIWVGAKEKLYQIDNNKKVEEVILDDKAYENPDYCNIRSIDEDEDGNLWFGTMDGGLVSYSPAKIIKRYMHDNNQNTSLANNRVIKVYIDEAGVLWAGTWSGGISMSNLKRKKFNNISVYKDMLNKFPSDVAYGLTEDKQGNFWIATFGDGIYKYNLYQNKYEDINKKYKNLKGKRFTETFCDSKGNIWIGSINHGLYRFDISGKVYAYKEELLDKIVTDIVEDELGNIWVGTKKGLNKYDAQKNSFISIAFPKADVSSSFNMATSIAMDAHGGIWVAGNKKLYLLDRKNLKFINIAFETQVGQLFLESSVLDIFISSQNIIWLLTDGNGVFAFNPKTRGIENLSSVDGLSNNVAYAILEDYEHKLWISTNRGISVYNPINHSFTRYDKNDGLTENEFNWRSGYATQKGLFIFGGINGFTIFDPQEIKTSKQLAKVKFTDFRVNHKDVEVGKMYNKKIILSKGINQVDKIYLRHTDYAVTFEFSALQYVNSQKVMYSYMLEGIDENWIETPSSRRTVTYTKLPSGNYKFMVKASNTDGVWNHIPISTTLIVQPPFWKTWWFISLMVINGIIIIYLLFLYRTRQLTSQKIVLETQVTHRTQELVEKTNKIEQQNQELENHRNHLESMIEKRTNDLKVAKEKAEESDRLKTSFLENLSHEIRTPMNAIYGFSQLIDDKNLTTIRRIKYIDAIKNSTNQLLSVFNDLIDISRIQSKQLEILEAEFSLNIFLEELQEEFYALARDKEKTSIDLKLVKGLPDDSCNILCDKYRLGQIYRKLVDNSLKFTDEGFVEFGYSLMGQKIQLFVRDTGIGISPQNQESIFDYFRQEEIGLSREYGGIGLGLSIAKGIVDLMGGAIQIQSSKGIGTSFFVDIPYKPAQQVPNSQNILIEDSSKHDWQSKKVLVVEDEDFNYIYIKEVLGKTGLHIDFARTGQRALEMFKECDYDLVLMDIKLPDISGIEVTKLIRLKGADTPIIAQTAHAMTMDKDKCLAAGCNDYIAKPYTKKQLLEIVSSNLFV